MFFDNAKAMVNVPILPTNIEMIMVILPATESDEVIPVDIPTVENADTTSKTKSVKLLSA